MKTEKKAAVRIPCNATVKNYTVATLKRLGLDAGPGRVFNNIISGKGVIPKNNRVVNDLVELLLKKIPTFIPPVAITDAEKKRFETFNEKWADSIIKLVGGQFTPIYLRDEVNKILLRKQYPVRCERIHLVWCLSLKGESWMTPEKVAAAIIEYDGNDWNDLPQLRNDTMYHVRLRDNTDAERKKFLDTVEFIYKLTSHSADSSLVEKLQNDVDVLSEFEKWKDDLTSYKYIERYEEFVSRLQTAPVVRKKKTATSPVIRKEPETSKSEGQDIIENESTTPSPTAAQPIIQPAEPDFDPGRWPLSPPLHHQ